MRALIFVAQRFFAQGSIQRERQALQPIFQDVVADALLDAIDRGFFSERSRHQQKRNVAPGRAQIGESVEPAPAGQTIVGQHGVQETIRQHPAKFVACFRQRRFNAKARIAKLEQNQLDVVRRMLDEQNAQRRGHVGERCFFQRRRFHVPAPGSESRKAAVGGG
jgi:hypothetical protein